MIFFSTSNMIISIFIAIISIAALCKIFSKMGERWWKALIPIYNAYILFKHIWTIKMFVFGIILGAVYACMSIYSVTLVNTHSFIVGQTEKILSFLGVASVIILVIAAIYGIVMLHRLSKSFGHGAGWTLGLLFLNTIFILMLGFGSSQYIGNAYELMIKEEKKRQNGTQN